MISFIFRFILTALNKFNVRFKENKNYVLGMFQTNFSKINQNQLVSSNIDKKYLSDLTDIKENSYSTLNNDEVILESTIAK